MAATPIIVPCTGLEAEEMRLSRWHVKNGALVRSGTLIATLDTSKVSNELECDRDGILYHLVAENTKIHVGDSLGSIQDEGETPIQVEISEIELAKVDQLRGDETRGNFITQLVKNLLK